MSLPHRRAGLILTALSVLTVAFIWGNSLIPSDLSVAISEKVSAVLSGSSAEAPVASDTPNSSETTGSAPSSPEPEAPNFVQHIRKAAHFAEFSVLGAELALLALLRRRGAGKTALFLCCHAVAAALIDETLQLFNDRHSLVRDVWIDLAGYAAGCAAALLLALFVCAVMRRARRIRRKA